MDVARPPSWKICTPYLTLPARAAVAGPGGFSYYDHVFLPENEKDLTWTHADRRYRSQVVIRLNGRRRTEAFLQVLDEAGRWQPMRLDDGTVSDGKVDTYTRCVAAVCGSADTFFTSVFSAQGRRPLSAYTSAEIKSLLGELLGHAAIREKSLRAAEVAKLLKTGLVTLRAVLADLELQWAAAQQARAGVAQAQAQGAQARAARDLAQTARLQAGQALATLQSLAEADAGNALQRTEIQVQLARIDETWKRAVDQLDAQKIAEQTRQSRLDASDCRSQPQGQ